MKLREDTTQCKWKNHREEKVISPQFCTTRNQEIRKENIPNEMHSNLLSLLTPFQIEDKLISNKGRGFLNPKGDI